MNGLDIPNNLIAQCERCHELLEFRIVRSNQIGVVENLSVIIPLPRTARISIKAKNELIKICARMTLRDGRLHSMEEVIDILMENYDKEHKE